MSFIFKELLTPLIHRVGSHAGMLLSGLGMAQGDVQTVTAALIILGGFGADLLVRKVI